jgi:hypothetical protein
MYVSLPKFYSAMSFLDFFSNIKDPRRPHGRRVSINQIIIMQVCGYVCGYRGYRGIARFCNAHKELFVKELGLKHGIPSYVTFRDVLTRLDQTELEDAFNKWASSDALQEGDWVSADGKCLKSTVTNALDAGQNYQNVVSVFSHKDNRIIAVGTFELKKGNEIAKVQDLIKLLNVKVNVRLDSLHCQKKL